MARSIWRGAIQFGLVTIPLRLYLATESRGISFNMLHATCHNRIQMKTYCPYDDEIIGRGDTVKGFEYAPGEYVVVTDEDLASVPLKTVRAIEIEQFVPVAGGDASTRFAKQAYYLEPEPIGRRAFALLRSILADAGLRAICKIVLREREQLAALDPFGPSMLLTTLYWPDEVRALGELDLPDAVAEVKPAERAMAEQLVAAMTGEFDPAAYRDQYREALMGVIEAKIAGAHVAPKAEAPGEGSLVDLMAALEASVAAAREQKRAAPARMVPPSGEAAGTEAAGPEAAGPEAAVEEAARRVAAARPVAAAKQVAVAKPERRRRSA